MFGHGLILFPVKPHWNLRPFFEIAIRVANPTRNAVVCRKETQPWNATAGRS